MSGPYREGRVREIINLTIQIKKSGRKTYLNEDEELFVVVSDNI